MAAKKIATMAVIKTIPLLQCPTSLSAKSINLQEIPECTIITPAKIKKGIANNVNLATLVYIISASKSNPAVPFTINNTMTDETPNDTAIGKPKKINRKNNANNINALMLLPPVLVTFLLILLQLLQ